MMEKTYAIKKDIMEHNFFLKLFKLYNAEKVFDATQSLDFIFGRTSAKGSGLLRTPNGNGIYDAVISRGPRFGLLTSEEANRRIQAFNRLLVNGGMLQIDLPRNLERRYSIQDMNDMLEDAGFGDFYAYSNHTFWPATELSDSVQIYSAKQSR